LEVEKPSRTPYVSVLSEWIVFRASGPYGAPDSITQDAEGDARAYSRDYGFSGAPSMTARRLDIYNG